MEKSSISSLVLFLLVMVILNDTEASRRGLLDYHIEVYRDGCKGLQRHICLFNFGGCHRCFYSRQANSPAIYHTMGN